MLLWQRICTSTLLLEGNPPLQLLLRLVGRLVEFVFLGDTLALHCLFYLGHQALEIGSVPMEYTLIDLAEWRILQAGE